MEQFSLSLEFLDVTTTAKKWCATTVRSLVRDASFSTHAQYFCIIIIILCCLALLPPLLQLLAEHGTRWAQHDDAGWLRCGPQPIGPDRSQPSLLVHIYMHFERSRDPSSTVPHHSKSTEGYAHVQTTTVQLLYFPGDRWWWRGTRKEYSSYVSFFSSPHFLHVFFSFILQYVVSLKPWIHGWVLYKKIPNLGGAWN